MFFSFAPVRFDCAIPTMLIFHSSSPSHRSRRPHHRPLPRHCPLLAAAIAHAALTIALFHAIALFLPPRLLLPPSPSPFAFDPCHRRSPTTVVTVALVAVARLRRRLHRCCHRHSRPLCLFATPVDGWLLHSPPAPRSLSQGVSCENSLARSLATSDSVAEGRPNPNQPNPSQQSPRQDLTRTNQTRPAPTQPNPT